MNEPITSLRELKKWNENPTELAPEVSTEWFLEMFFREILAEDQHFTAANARKDLAKYYEISEKIEEEASLAKVDAMLEEWAVKNSVPDTENTTYISIDKHRDWNMYLYKFTNHYVKNVTHGLRKLQW